jgi:hypothetical protein
LAGDNILKYKQIYARIALSLISRGTGGHLLALSERLEIYVVIGEQMRRGVLIAG